MAKLTDLGFSKGIIFETIVSTYNLQWNTQRCTYGRHHGRRTNPQPKHLQFITNQPQPQNKQMRRHQFNNDIEVFYRSTFKEANPMESCRLNGLKKQSVNAPKLRWADATIDVSVVNMHHREEKTNFSATLNK